MTTDACELQQTCLAARILALPFFHNAQSNLREYSEGISEIEYFAPIVFLNNFFLLSYVSFYIFKICFEHYINTLVSTQYSVRHYLFE